MTAPSHVPGGALNGFEPMIVGPVSSYDLMAIGPFLLAAIVVAGVRKFKRRNE
jgi:hypothetical protein